MKLYRKKEQGLTLITIVIILLIIAFFTTLVLKIAPIYINHSRVLNTLKSLESKEAIEKKSKRRVQILIAKSFNINYVEKVDQEDITITKRGPFYLKVEIEYEVVEPIFGNLSVLVEFYDFIEVGEL